ncbi:MAG: deoxyuridine 5'-triphosphate nucleotidohydrolase [Candidatus Brockarchaeota archaeon]|nr:deoxyuridine 5'-triphosphate nucleotidohydrolase [Candidatus Brockarchaeota archaeon]
MPALSGRRMVEMGVVEGLRSVEEQVQPAGVDLTLEKIEVLVEEGEISAEPRFSKGLNIIPKTGFYELPQGSYRVTYHEIVNIPAGYLGLLLPRSSLLRNGATIYTAVWDPGYKGRGMGLMVVFNRRGIRIAEEARVAQLILLSLEGSSELYKGRFMFENMELSERLGVY